MKTLKGSCLCSAVTFELEDDFYDFHLCHCTQCQKISGSSNAANAFTRPDNLRWLSGEDKIKRFDYPGRQFTTVFCTECGSGLPFTTVDGKHLIVPVGCLDEQPTLKPQDNIFWQERMAWHDESFQAKKFDGFPS
ncbi:GFA family protein [Sessilibacter sp. MAH2]